MVTIRIVGYGTTAGIVGGEINTGKGNDYIRAAKIERDPLTGEISFSQDQTGSIRDVKIFGRDGNDTFEIGGFAGVVQLDGGKDFDVLKLWGNLSDYRIIIGSSENKTLTFEDSSSMMTVQNVEEFYFGDSNRVYTFQDFA